MPDAFVCAEAKSQTIEAQLADTTAQLNELKVKQKQLEARNALLEKVATMNRQSSTGSSSSPSLPADDRNPWQVRLSHAHELRFCTLLASSTTPCCSCFPRA